jgi:hypothetical protein
VQLDGSSLVDPSPEPTPTVTVTAEPSPSPDPSTPAIEQLTTEVEGFRELFLYAGGVLIFLLAVLVFRARRTG